MDILAEIDLTQPPNPKRLALARFAVAMCQLLTAFGIESEVVDNLTVNFDGHSKRLDVAQLDAEGHLDRILLSLAADPNQAETFATEIGVPGQPVGQTH